jgi:hypothetical protein
MQGLLSHKEDSCRTYVSNYRQRMTRPYRHLVELDNQIGHHSVYEDLEVCSEQLVVNSNREAAFSLSKHKRYIILFHQMLCEV